jgi:hypothetical protein
MSSRNVMMCTRWHRPTKLSPTMRGEITLAKLDCISGLNDASAFAGAFFFM